MGLCVWRSDPLSSRGLHVHPHVTLLLTLGRVFGMQARFSLICVCVTLLGDLSFGQGQQMSCADMEQFLREARIVKVRDSSKGVTHPKHATLEKDSLEHDASIQNVDARLKALTGGQRAELNLHDFWGYNIAGYELAKLLSINMVPPYVERRYEGNRSSFSWWIPNVMMDAAERFQRKVEPPDPERWNREMWVIRVFDQLIGNVDNNLTNFLITKDWHVWMIDFSRAFRPYKTLRKPEDLVRCDRRLLDNLRQLDKPLLEQKLRPYLTRSDIEALLARRDEIVKYFADEIARKGEAAVLFELDRVGEACGAGL